MHHLQWAFLTRPQMIQRFGSNVYTSLSITLKNTSDTHQNVYSRPIYVACTLLLRLCSILVKQSQGAAIVKSSQVNFISRAHLKTTMVDQSAAQHTEYNVSYWRGSITLNGTLS